MAQGKFKDLTGKKFGRLTVLERAETRISPKGYKTVQWLCQCDCGEIIKVSTCRLNFGQQGCRKCKNHKEKENIVGKTFVHKKYGEYEVLNETTPKYNNRRFTVRFKNTGYTCVRQYSLVVSGVVKDNSYYDKKVIGQTFVNQDGLEFKVLSKDKTRKGYFIVKFKKSKNEYSSSRCHIVEGYVKDANDYKPKTYIIINGKKYKRRSYKIWNSMVDRETYKNIKVCDEWKKDFWSFYDWLEKVELPKHNVSIEDYETYKALENYDLDKDFKVKDCRLYSPETCSLLPRKFNIYLNYFQHCHIVAYNKQGKRVEITDLLDFITAQGYTIDYDETLRIATDINK